MTRQDIEKAISFWKDVDLATREGKEKRKILIHVAKAWLALEQYFINNDCLKLSKMQELLNPAPKSDLQRIREWATAVGRQGELLLLLDQLEAEHKEKP